MPAGSLDMPNPSTDTPPISSVVHDGSVVIVGANGTGKSRLGALFEQRSRYTPPAGGYDFRVRRISAQRSLALPDISGPVTVVQARQMVARGGQAPNANSRIPGDAVTGQLGDFQILVQALFAERGAQALAYTKASRSPGQPLVRPDESILDRLVRTWQKVFPERELVIGDDDTSIRVQSPNGEKPYGGSSMSDGERVGFYLLAHALLAPEGITLLIDEPELHLHESIQGLLWDTIEAERDDCVFIHITHDLGFAASRVRAAKVLLHGYEAGLGKPTWDWQMAPAGFGLPEDVMLRIAGSRRPTVFVEGITGSVDQELYDAAYPDKYIVPSDNCDAVIQAVHSFHNHTALHRFDVCGIIDRDDRETEEVTALLAKRIHALEYAQAENVLVADEIMRAFCAHQEHDIAKTALLVSDARRRVLDLLKRERETTIARLARWTVERNLHRLSHIGPTEADLVTAVTQATTAADAHSAFLHATKVIDAALAANDYEASLRLMRNKGVVPEACAALGARPDAYRRIAVSLIRKDAALRKSLSRVLPNL